MRKGLNGMLMAGAAACALMLAAPVVIGASGDFGKAFAQSGEKGGAGKGQMGGGKSGGAGKGQMGAGKGGGGSLLDQVLRGEEEDSDRPSWAGVGGGKSGGKIGQAGGGKKGDLFGDLVVIVRDANGVPIYYVWQDTNGDGVNDTPVVSANGFPQPIAADGSLVPLNAEGEPIDEALLQEVEFSRLNIARSPDRVLSSRYLEAITAINAADSISLDASGRLVLTTDGETKTIDAPLENLAIYVELMNTGTLKGVTVDPSVLGSLATLVDGQLTDADIKMAVSFLAAAADKFGTLGVDQVVYINSILGLDGAITGPDNVKYVDYSSFTYDRAATYSDVVVKVLVQTSEGTWVEKEVNIYETLFNSTQATGTAVTGFAQAADDALQVVEYVHTYEVPAPTTTQ